MNIYTLTKYIFTSEQRIIEFCKEYKLFPEEVKCKHCKKELSLCKWAPTISVSFSWKCKNSRCPKYRNTVTGKRNTWFSYSKMSIEKVLLITYCFCARFPNHLALRETSILNKMTSTETIVDWYTYSMELCCQIVAEKSQSIGGPGYTVEIDEAKFGKRKYNKGRLVDGVWVFGGICRETKECFLVPVKKRDSQTLIPLIQKHILPGTRIISDCWKSYDVLSEMDFTHLTVNHSVNFVDPETGANTQTIESTWWQIKRGLPETHTRHDRLYLYLGEYLWRKIAEKERKDEFLYFLECVNLIK